MINAISVSKGGTHLPNRKYQVYFIHEALVRKGSRNFKHWVDIGKHQRLNALLLFCRKKNRLQQARKSVG